jgi:hypothetical protein
MCRTDDVVGRRVEGGPQSCELSRGAVCELLRCQALTCGGLLHLLAVLVHARDEKNVITIEPLEPGDRVGRNALVGVTDVRGTIGVRNSGCDVVGPRVTHRLENPKNMRGSIGARSSYHESAAVHHWSGQNHIALSRSRNARSVVNVSL